jgi:hypothetical protein
MELELDFIQKLTGENRNEKNLRCECCGRLMVIYHRPINSNMAFTLLQLYRHKEFNFVHVERWLKEKGYPRSGDFHKLIYWGFLEKKHEEREDGCKYNGYYKITGRGIMFCENKITAKEKAQIYNNKFLGFEGKEITIQDALGKKFNYSELMSETI